MSQRIAFWLVVSLTLLVNVDRLIADGADRAAKVAPLVAQLQAEVDKLSPALKTAVNWASLQTTLINAGQEPDFSLARGALLCQVYNLADWPVDQRLALLRATAKDPSVAVRRLSVDLLSRAEAVKAGSLDDLKNVVKDEKDPGVRVLAARQLLQNGDPAGWAPMLSALYSDDEKVRGSGAVQASPQRDAKEALIELSLEHWKFGGNAARLPDSLKLTPDVIELAKKAFKMDDNVIRRTVVEIIGLGRDKAHLPLLLERLEAEKAWTVHRSIHLSLGYMGDKSVVPVLVDHFGKPRVERTGRQMQARGLAVLGDVSGLEALVSLLEKGEGMDVLAAALSRAFDPAFNIDDAAFYAVPDATGKLVGAWIPSASTSAAPMIDDGKGGKARAAEMSAKDVHAAWAKFLKDFGAKLKWDAGKGCWSL